MLLNLRALTRMIWHAQKKSVIKKIIYSVARLCKKKKSSLNIAVWDLYEICKCLLAGGTREAAIDQMHTDMLFEQLQPVIRLGTKQAGVVALLQVHLKVFLQYCTAQKAFIALVAHVSAAFPAVVTHVLFQPVLLPEGFSTKRALEGAEWLPNEEMLKGSVLQGEERRGKIETMAFTAYDHTTPFPKKSLLKMNKNKMWRFVNNVKSILNYKRDKCNFSKAEAEILF